MSISGYTHDPIVPAVSNVSNGSGNDPGRNSHFDEYQRTAYPQHFVPPQPPMSKPEFDDFGPMGNGNNGVPFITSQQPTVIPGSMRTDDGLWPPHAVGMQQPIPWMKPNQKSSSGGGNGNPSTPKSHRKKPQRPVEVIICKGTETIVPKCRSQGERRYVCNGHTIHRVTFWRHRKHGCPHSTGGPGMDVGSVQDSPIKNSMEGHTIGHSHSFHDHHFSHQDMDHRMDHHMDHHAMRGMKTTTAPMPMGFQIMDGTVEIAHGALPSKIYQVSQNGPGMMPGMNSMKSPFPALELGALANTSMHTSESLMSGQMSHHMRTGPLPPFSLVPDTLNFVYAPYRPAELDDEGEINTLGAPYVPPSPYGSDRSEASDFLDDGDLFNSYLERGDNGL